MNIQDRARSVLAGVKRVMEAGTPLPWEINDHPSSDAAQCGVSIDQVYEGSGIRGHTIVDTFNRGYKVSLVDCDEDGQWYDKAGMEDAKKLCLGVKFLPSLVLAIQGLLDEIETSVHVAESKRSAERLEVLLGVIEPELVRVEGRK